MGYGGRACHFLEPVGIIGIAFGIGIELFNEFAELFVLAVYRAPDSFDRRFKRYYVDVEIMRIAVANMRAVVIERGSPAFGKGSLSDPA